MNTRERTREERFRSLFTDSYADVLRFVQRRAHPSHAEDVAAEVFLVAWRRFDDLPRLRGDQRAWLFGAARTCLLASYRGSQRDQALAVRLGEHPSAPDPLALDPDLLIRRADLAAAWRRLDPNDQEVLALTVFEGLSSSEAARVLDTNAGAYRVRLLRARTRLRALSGDTAATPEPLPKDTRYEHL